MRSKFWGSEGGRKVRGREGGTREGGGRGTS